MGTLLIIILIYCIGVMIMATALVWNPSISQNYSELEYFVMVAIWPIILGIMCFKVIKKLCYDS